jgi:hypothetical protein
MRPARPVCFRLLCATLLVASFASAPAALAEKAAVFAAGDRALDIPIVVEDNGHVFAQFKVNGVGPVWFALDTGAGHAGINSDFAQQLKIQVTGKKGVARGAGGSQAAENGEHIEFALPGVTLRDQKAAIYAMEFMSRRVGRPVAGIIGREFFAAFVVELDFAGQRMHLYDPRTYQYTGKGSSIPLTFEYGHPYAEAVVVLPNDQRVPGRFTLDLGSAFPLMLSERATAEHGVLKALAASVSIQARGVGGPVETVVGRVASVRLGDFTIASPFAAFPQGSQGYITAAGSPGNIGAPVLSRFRVIFDYSRKRMILEPGPRFAEPFDFDMSGLSVQVEGDAFDRFTVSRITPGSPAEAAGFAVGDRIVAVNGEPVAGIATLRRMMRQPDRQYDVAVRRGEATQTVKLTTRKMI